MKYELQAFIDLIGRGSAGAERYNERTLPQVAIVDMKDKETWGQSPHTP